MELARSAGFCYGVRRAVQMAEMAAEEGRPCVMLGPIIHNRDVIAYLESIGVGLVDTPEEVPPGTAVLIRSHGEGRPVHEALARLGRPVIDATCPNVSRIHQIVSRAEEGGRQVLIIGTRTHPEVAAIAGWCRRPVVLEGAEELSNWLETAPERRDIPLTMVSQTTSTRFIWDSCVEKAKKECTNLKIFDTICNATCKRQSEAQALAARSDAMVVIGGRESSNTKRLAELCGALCPMVVWIERAAELEPSNLCRKASIGITAGASTPEWIIKEVYDKMSDENIEIEESFAEMLEKSIKTLNTGEKVTGVVTGITPTEIYVDLGTKHAGYIPVSELTDDPTAKVEDLVKIGDEIETYVMRVNDQEGVVTLSKKRLDTVKSWDDIEQAREEHTTVEGVVTEENKGGVVVSIKGVRVFVPASQTGLPRETPMSQLLKQHVRLRITEVNRARRRVVGSIRAVEAEERAAKAAEVWANIEENKRYTGTVKSLTSYGAFVDIGGVDGMVHISELSWSRIKHPSEVVSVGDTVEVYVISFDKEKKKISLGMKDRSQNPWEVFIGKYQPGDVANVRVVKLMTFGAFAEVVPGVDGLIHISQIADHRIDKPGDVLSEGQMVDVKIIDIDYDNKKVSLSIRALLEGGDEPAESEDVNEE
nr:bifunctional 4-hydroxy-3-methylbut-2-enyl diphosphate reductase/30S ribosomal protein S1 [Flavonifractor plautii]